LTEANSERSQLGVREAQLRTHHDLLQARLAEVRAQLSEAEAALHRWGRRDGALMGCSHSANPLAHACLPILLPGARALQARAGPVEIQGRPVCACCRLVRGPF